MDHVTLQNGSLLVEISPLGAEVQRVRDREGVERLWDGDPAFWAGRAPVLFPVAGALKEDAYTLDGRRYTLAKHGFARKRMFTVESLSPTDATFLLAGEAARDPGFPFAYTFRARYALDGNRLIVDYQVENLGRETFWFGVGAHEAYACPEGIGAYEIVFDQPETLTHAVLEGGLLTGETVPVPTQGRVLRLGEALSINDCLVLGGHRSRGLTLRSEAHDRRARVDFGDFEYLLLWTVPGAGFVCIEPWSNLPDRVDTDGDITQKAGMLALAPGQSRVLTHEVRFE